VNLSNYHFSIASLSAADDAWVLWAKGGERQAHDAPNAQLRGLLNSKKRTSGLQRTGPGAATHTLPVSRGQGGINAERVTTASGALR